VGSPSQASRPLARPLRTKELPIPHPARPIPKPGHPSSLLQNPGRAWERERLVFSLRHLESMTFAEIATAMEISLSTVKRAHARAVVDVTRWIASDRDLAGFFEESKGPMEREGIAGWCRSHRAAAEFVRSAIAPMTPRRARAGSTSEARLAGRQRQRVRLLRLSFVAWRGCGCLCLAVVISGARMAVPQATSLAYRLKEGDRRRRIPALVGQCGVRLRFAEGSELEFLAGARGRLRSVDASGARFAIERGTASVKVAHRPGAHWLVDADLSHHGERTTFTVAWDATGEQLDLRMEQGWFRSPGRFPRAPSPWARASAWPSTSPSEKWSCERWMALRFRLLAVPRFRLSPSSARQARS